MQVVAPEIAADIHETEIPTQLVCVRVHQAMACVHVDPAREPSRDASASALAHFVPQLVLPAPPIRASPAARRRAAELGVDLDGLAARVGPRVTVAAVESAALVHPERNLPEPEHGEDGVEATAPAPAANLPSSGPSSGSSSGLGPRRHLHALVDVTGLDAARRRYQDDRAGVAAPLLGFVAKACAVSLRQHPRMNASVIRSGRALAISHAVHLGLVHVGRRSAPLVLAHAERRSLAQIIAALAGGLTEGSCPSADTNTDVPAATLPPTFTLTIAGGVGEIGGLVSVASRPLAPHVAALALGRPRAHGGRFRLPLQLAYDPRIHEQDAADGFLAHLADLLADPIALLMWS